jgi:hypothetical protein
MDFIINLNGLLMKLKILNAANRLRINSLMKGLFLIKCNKKIEEKNRRNYQIFQENDKCLIIIVKK